MLKPAADSASVSLRSLPLKISFCDAGATPQSSKRGRERETEKERAREHVCLILFGQLLKHVQDAVYRTE